MPRPTTKNYEENYKRHTVYITKGNLEKLNNSADPNNGGKAAIINSALELYFAVNEPLTKLYKSE
jgi:hypothetical protein